MKKFSPLILFALITLVLLFSLGSCNVDAAGETCNRYNYLVCGFDDAFQNTDVILIASIDTDNDRLDIIQIPRDTAYSDGKQIYKINSVYPQKKFSGMNKKEALGFLTNELSDIFGIEFNGFFGLTTENLRDAVNTLGGIEVTIPQSFNDKLLRTLGLSYGKNVLYGDDVLRLVRHRKSYATGDLGRVDAQKLVLSGLIKKFQDNFDFSIALNTIMELDGVTSNFKIRDIVKILGSSRGNFKNYTLSFSNLCGTAEADKDGIWYFVANKKANCKLLSELKFNHAVDFDPSGKLVPWGNEKLIKLYRKSGISPKIYYNDEILSISFKTNN